MLAPNLGYASGRHIPEDRGMHEGARLYMATLSLRPRTYGPLVEDGEDPHPDSEDAEHFIFDAKTLGIQAKA